MMNVILNEVKNLLRDNTLSTLSLVGFEEILRCAQDDKVQRGDCHEPSALAMTEYSISLAMTMLCASITNY